MKNGVILARKSTWRSSLDLNYLDETSDRKVSQREKLSDASEVGRKLKQFADYASKETLGQVHAGGFLHDLIRVNPDGSSTAPSKLSNEERKKRISDAWFQHLRRYPSQSRKPVVQHRLVFSMSSEWHNDLVAAGLNPDRVLHSTMKKVMGKFAEKFHAADSIGYAYGFHHDTDNLHVHVALCPRTAKGSYVGCSTSRTASSGNRNQLDFLRSCFERENERWTQLMSSPEKLEEHLSKRLDSDRIVSIKKLNHFELAALRANQTHEAIRLQQLYRNIQHLEYSLSVQRSALAGKRSLRIVSRLIGHRRSSDTTISKITTALNRKSIREMQAQLFRMKREYRSMHRRYSQLFGFTAYGNRNTPIQHTHQQRHPL